MVKDCVVADLVRANSRLLSLALLVALFTPLGAPDRLDMLAMYTQVAEFTPRSSPWIEEFWYQWQRRCAGRGFRCNVGAQYRMVAT